MAIWHLSLHWYRNFVTLIADSWFPQERIFRHLLLSTRAHFFIWNYCTILSIVLWDLKLLLACTNYCINKKLQLCLNSGRHSYFNVTQKGKYIIYTWPLLSNPFDQCLKASQYICIHVKPTWAELFPDLEPKKTTKKIW